MVEQLHSFEDVLAPTGNAEWTLVQLSARKLSVPLPDGSTISSVTSREETPEEALDSSTDSDQGDFRVVMQTKSTESAFSISAALSASVPEVIEYRVHIIGTWPHGLGRELTKEEMQVAAAGYRLDELAAVVNFELQNFSGRFNESFPAITQEMLRQVRKDQQKSS